MYKHEWNMDHIHEGKIYRTIDGIVELPVRVEKLNPLEEEKKTDWKALGTDAGLKGDDLKKFMSKNKDARQKQLDKLKEAE